MAGDQDKVLDTASSIADGAEVDWREAEAAATNEEDRRLLRQLRLLAGIAGVHRSAAEGPEAEEDAEAGSLGEAAARVRPAAPEAVLGRWGHLELLEKVGEGTFGEVYRARDTRLDRDVALKLLRSEASRTRLVERVLHEGRTLARIRHPNVVTVYGVEEHDGRVGLWMELVQGNTLAALLARQGPYSAREAALIGQDLCRALAAVHGAGLCHRDIKAQNVMREHGGRVVLMDFGAGRHRDATGQESRHRMTGTPMYLAPELLGGDADATIRTDIYSVGVLLYYLVTRGYPVRATSIESLQREHAEGRRTPLHDARPDLPDGFVSVVERALHPDPEPRYASAGALQSALAASLGLEVASQAIVAGHQRTTWRRSATTGAVARDPRVVGPSDASGWTLPWRVMASVGAMALVALLVLLVMWPRGPSPVADPDHVPLLVIRAFEPMTPRDRVLAAGLTSEISRQLGMLQAPLSVVPVQGIERLPSDTTEEGVMEQVGADALLSGRVGQQDGELVVSVRIVRAGQTGSAWTPPAFTRPVRESFELTEHLAEEIASELSAWRRRERRQARPVNPDAWDAYLRARYELSQANARAAIPLLQKARRLELEFAEADAALARAFLWNTYSGTTPDEHETLIVAARDAAREALGLNPDLAEAHFVLADISFIEEWNWTAAEEQFANAIRLGPDDEFVRYRYAMFLAARQRIDEALAVIAEGRRLSPLSPVIAGYEGQIRYFARQYDEAIEAFKRALSLDSSHTPARQGLCHTYRAMGQAQAALPECVGRLRAHEAQVRARRSDAGEADAATLATDRQWHWLRAEVAQTLVALGRRDEALEILADLRQARAARADTVMSEALAFVLTALGEHDEAFEWLERAVSEKSRAMPYLTVDPRVDPLRTDQRYQVLAKRLGLD